MSETWALLVTGVMLVSCFCLRVKWPEQHGRSRERAQGTSSKYLTKMTEIEELANDEETW